MNIFKFIKDADIKTSEIMEAVNIYLTSTVDTVESYYVIHRFWLYEFIYEHSTIDVTEKEINSLLERALTHFNINHKYIIAITPKVIFIGKK